MISHFLNLEWKQYFRSAHWQKGIAIKIIMVFFALYFVATFLAIGVALIEYKMSLELNTSTKTITQLQMN